MSPLLTRKLASVANRQKLLPLAKVTLEPQAFGNLKRRDDAVLHPAELCLRFSLVEPIPHLRVQKICQRLEPSQYRETFSVLKCVKTEVDAGKLVTNRNNNSVGQLFSLRYLQKRRLQMDA